MLSPHFMLILLVLTCAAFTFPTFALEPIKQPPVVRLLNKTGQTFDQCRSQPDCTDQHRCLDIATFPSAPLCTGATSCRCLPPLPNTCTTSDSCPPGEVCARSPTSTSPICVSAVFEDTSLTFNELAAGEVAPTPTPTVHGLTWDYCQAQSDCRMGRTCLFVEDESVCAERDPCVCQPLIRRFCQSNEPGQCEPGEVCARILGLIVASKSCVSLTTANFLSNVFVVVTPTPTPLPADKGYTLDSCGSRSQEDCRFGRQCVMVPVNERVPCPRVSFAECKCYPTFSITQCETDVDCDVAETCQVDAFSGTRICMSRVAVREQPSLVQQEDGDQPLPSPLLLTSPSPSPLVPTPIQGGGTDGIAMIPTVEASNEEEADLNPAEASASASAFPSASAAGQEEAPADGGVCVDTRALQHLRGDDLVLAHGVMARVMCDVSGSCATGGHMVVFRGVGMMMRRYCDMVGCRTQVMEVNSPRWKRGLSVRSRTEGLVYTAFAARFETRMEETALRLAVAAGL